MPTNFLNGYGILTWIQNKDKFSFRSYVAFIRDDGQWVYIRTLKVFGNIMFYAGNISIGSNITCILQIIKLIYYYKEFHDDKKSIRCGAIGKFVIYDVFFGLAFG